MVRRKVPSSFFSLSQASPVKESRNKRVGQNEMQEGMAAPSITTFSVRRKRGKQPLVPASQESDGMDGSSEEGDESMAVPKKKGRKEYVIHEEAGPSSAPSEKFPPLSEDGLSKMKKLALAMEEERTIMCLYSDGSYRAAKVLDKMWTPEGLLKYYVHYIDMSRRDDKWVLLKDLNPDLVVPPLSRRHDKLVLLKDLNPVSVVPAVDKKADTQVDCRIFFPPGNQIYADRYLAVFEADGSKFSGFAKNLCCLAKMFLDHKSLDFEVKAFTFYILGEKDRQGFHVAAYFSKEKDSENTLSCILTLPQHQRKGFGSFLIELGTYAMVERFVR